MNPTIASILRNPHAQRPIRGLPGGALCFLRHAVGTDRFGECRCWGNVSVRACSPVRSSLGLDCCVGRRVRVGGLGCGGSDRVASVTRGFPVVGSRCGAGRGRCWSMVVVRPTQLRARIAEPNGVCGGSSEQDPAALSVRKRWPALDLGGATRQLGALERPSPRSRIKSRLSTCLRLSGAGIAGLGSRPAFCSTPWVIFPRA